MSISEAKRYVDLANKMLEIEVVKERRAGATWQQIGDQLGVTHQGARSRWNPVVKALEAKHAPRLNALEAQQASGHNDGRGILSAADHARRVDTDALVGPGNDGD